MAEIVVARRGDAVLDERLLQSMYRLRHEVFHDRLGWKVNSDRGMEHDEFDELDPVYLLARQDIRVDGCWRLLPTHGPNMLRDVFPQLLGGAPAPASHGTWELSRFAIREGTSDGTSFGLSTLPLHMLIVALRFGAANGIDRYVSVTSVAIERMFRKLGIAVERLGPALKIGRVATVACAMPCDRGTLQLAELAALGPAPSKAA